MIRPRLQVAKGGGVKKMEQAIELLTSQRYSVYRNILSVVGAACVFKFLVRSLWSVAGGFCAYFLAPWGISRLDLKKYGSWAIVTGASEGIGRAYAIELAKRGLNIAIMSRSEEKLKKVADEIRERYGREVRYLSVDFSNGQDVYDDIQAEISDIDVAILVNNVGLSSEYPMFTAENDEQRHRNIIELNCQAMVQMTHLVLPKMIEKKHGIIVNVSSQASIVPAPLLNVYAATKKFVQYFSDALRYEYKSQGIVVQTVYPGVVSTAMSGIRRPRFWSPSPETYAKSAVATIGIQSNTSGILIHALQGYIMSSLPESLAMRVYYRALVGIRQKRLNRGRSQKKD